MIGTVIGIILIHLGIGVITSFIVLYVAHRDFWNTDDRQALSIVSIPVWPLVLPIILIVQLYRGLDRKAKALAERKRAS